MFPKLTQPVTSIAFLLNPPIEDRKRRRKNCLPQQLPLNHPKTVISPHLKQNVPKGPFGRRLTLRQFYIYHLVKSFWQLAGDSGGEIMEDFITPVRRTVTDGQRVKIMISFSLQLSLGQFSTLSSEEMVCKRGDGFYQHGPQFTLRMKRGP